MSTSGNLHTQLFARFLWQYTAILSFTCMGGQSSKENNMSRSVIIPPRLKHTASVIFLHGLGDTGDGWASGFRELNLPNVRLVCPNAPVQPVTLNGGMKMPSWYDIYQLTAEGREDGDGIKQSSLIVQQAIADEEKLGIPTNRIILGGFSQGGALALYTAFVCGKPLAAVVGLSTYLPLRQSFPQCITANKETPVFQGHGLLDPVIPHHWGKMTSDILNKFNPNCVFKSYDNLMHGSSQEEMSDVKTFILKHIPD